MLAWSGDDLCYIVCLLLLEELLLLPLHQMLDYPYSDISAKITTYIDASTRKQIHIVYY